MLFLNEHNYIYLKHRYSLPVLCAYIYAFLFLELKSRTVSDEAAGKMCCVAGYKKR